MTMLDRFEKQGITLETTETRYRAYHDGVMIASSPNMRSAWHTTVEYCTKLEAQQQAREHLGLPAKEQAITITIARKDYGYNVTELDFEPTTATVFNAVETAGGYYLEVLDAQVSKGYFVLRAFSTLQSAMQFCDANAKMARIKESITNA